MYSLNLRITSGQCSSPSPYQASRYVTQLRWQEVTLRTSTMFCKHIVCSAASLLPFLVCFWWVSPCERMVSSGSSEKAFRNTNHMLWFIVTIATLKERAARACVCVCVCCPWFYLLKTSMCWEGSTEFHHFSTETLIYFYTRKNVYCSYCLAV